MPAQQFLTEWQPIIFLGLMGLAMLIYVVLDGFDLGVGMLLPLARNEADQDMMVASIGPFWDANETWLVLGVGILLIAFPQAHGIVLQHLYLPVAVMLIGLILRGVAFDFRVKARDQHKQLWNQAFFIGSSVAAIAQGWMLGRYVTGFGEGWVHLIFALLIATTLPAAYLMLGSTWLLMRTEHELQRDALVWARRAWPAMVLGLIAISLATPLASPTVAGRWFALPQIIALLPIPIATALFLVAARMLLNGSTTLGRLCWVPFVLLVLVFVLGYLGLAYSIYPYVVMDQLTIWQAASAPESLFVILIGAVVTVPAILLYTVFSYRVFWGKAQLMHYS